MKIVVSESAKPEIDGLNPTMETLICGVLDHVPPSDIRGISYIFVTLEPEEETVWERGSSSYDPRRTGQPAFVSVYLRRLLPLTMDQAIRLPPILESSLADTLFWAVGAHLAATRSHGLRPSKKAAYADRYRQRRMNRYVLARERDWTWWFDQVEKNPSDWGAKADIIRLMRKQQEAEYEAARKAVSD